jgi:hypothetical protein
LVGRHVGEEAARSALHSFSRELEMEASTTVTISLLVIAASTATLAVLGIAVAVMSMRLVREFQRGLDAEALPALRAAREAADNLHALTGSVRDETQDVVALVGDLRGRVERATDRFADRLDDFDALFDVVYDEVESTALDVAAGLRTARRGRKVLGRMRRALLRRR